VGLLQGGRAPNVIPDLAQAELLYRLVGPSEALRREILETVSGLAEVNFTLEIPFVRLRTLEGLPTMVAAFTTDTPADRAGINSRRTHRGRVRGEAAADRRGRDLLPYCKKPYDGIGSLTHPKNASQQICIARAPARGLR
jgi:hypothetical protein